MVESNSFYKNSHYILFGSVLFIIGFIIFIIYWMKRQRHRNYSKKINQSATSESNDVRVKYRNSEDSIFQDDE
jgi:flagellar biogenesis protein FliO